MNGLLGSPKTSVTGVLTILGGLIHAYLQYANKQPVDMPTLVAAFSAGFGLIMASDHPSK